MIEEHENGHLEGGDPQGVSIGDLGLLHAGLGATFLQMKPHRGFF